MSVADPEETGERMPAAHPRLFCSALHPDTHELVSERYIHDWLRTSISTYWDNADRLSTATATDGPSSFLGTTYVNGGHVKARGLELEAQARLGHGRFTRAGCHPRRTASRSASA